MRSTKVLMVAVLAVLALFASACSIDIERNADGSLQIDGEITADSLATEFERDPENNSVAVAINDGIMLIDVEGVDENGEYVANLRVELSADNGVLVVDITEAFYNGWTVPEAIRTEFNDAIAKEIRKAVQENPDATLVSLVADDGKIVTEWRIETEASNGN
jgi:ABC-type glycerol-3-phosphate transport system substrate-binding protein